MLTSQKEPYRALCTSLWASTKTLMKYSYPAQIKCLKLHAFTHHNYIIRNIMQVATLVGQPVSSAIKLP